MMTMMAMTMAACGTDEETACQSYDTGSNNYEVAADSGYDYDYESSFDDDCANEANTNSGTSDSSVSTDSTVTACSYDEDWDYNYDYDNDEVEAAGAEPDSTADYASDAQVRTNEVEFIAGYPNIGGTEAELEAEVINRNGGTIQMVGCTVYDEMGIAVASWNEPCNITDNTFDITCSTNKDLNCILQDRIYQFRFVAEIDGEFFTHKAVTFTTNHADDKFMFQVQPVALTKDTATVSVKITNPTMENVASVGCRVNTPQGIQLADEKKIVNTTDQSFIVNFELKNGNESLPSEEDYGYQFYIKYNGTEYTSCYEDFTTLP